MKLNPATGMLEFFVNKTFLTLELKAKIEGNKDSLVHMKNEVVILSFRNDI